MTARWYALHSKPMKEVLLWQQLSLHEIEGYYPCLRVQLMKPFSKAAYRAENG
jgi:hypothetical protein